MVSLTCVCSCVSLEIECIVETLPTYRTQVSLDFAVTFQMTIQQPLKWERFATYTACEVLSFFRWWREQWNWRTRTQMDFFWYYRVYDQYQCNSCLIKNIYIFAAIQIQIIFSNTLIKLKLIYLHGLIDEVRTLWSWACAMMGFFIPNPPLMSSTPWTIDCWNFKRHLQLIDLNQILKCVLL